MQIKANAKINLALNVIERLPNGYHSLDMIMLPLALHDKIEIEEAKADKISFNDSSLNNLDTTVHKALALFKQDQAIDKCFNIKVNKQIPMEAGLAGGSADAAAILKGLNKLCNTNLSTEYLANLGKQVGADVPFCVYNTGARVKGIGEIIKPIGYSLPKHVLLIKPNQGVSTKLAFESLDFDTTQHPDLDKIEYALLHEQSEVLKTELANTLEQSAFKLVPEIAKIKNHLLAMKFDYVLMSGSGSTVFALTDDEKILQAAMDLYDACGIFVCKTSFI